MCVLNIYIFIGHTCSRFFNQATDTFGIPCMRNKLSLYYLCYLVDDTKPIVAKLLIGLGMVYLVLDGTNDKINVCTAKLGNI